MGERNPNLPLMKTVITSEHTARLLGIPVTREEAESAQKTNDGKRTFFSKLKQIISKKSAT